MGKWTPNYTDNVLNCKISALITGAINRAAVEKEPTITFDDFVKELDTGDAFTTSLIDILVKEIAERHERTDERRMAPRTAERLVSLANQRLYRERPRNHHAGRRTYNLAEFMSIPANEMDVDDEDNDFGNLLDPSTGVSEGARFNTDLFEAYGSHAWPPIGRRMGTTPSPPLEPEPVWRPLGSLSNAGRNTWAAVPTPSSTSATTLARHSSIRRPGRSRLVDFHDWTSRRRSTARDTSGPQPEVPESSSSLSLGSDTESAQTVRRFFPTSGHRLERRPESRQDRAGLDGGRSPSIPVDREWSPVATQAGPSSLDYHQMTGAPRTEADERPLPRLRRGGVRPPESLWTHRYSWSAPTSASRPAELNDASSSTDFILAAGAPTRPGSPPGRENDTSSTSTEPVGYPTPGSIENEPASV